MLVQSQTRKALLPPKQSVLWDAPSPGVHIPSYSCCLEAYIFLQCETEGKVAILIYFFVFYKMSKMRPVSPDCW